jgi:hypothetical protein
MKITNEVFQISGIGSIILVVRTNKPVANTAVKK